MRRILLGACVMLSLATAPAFSAERVEGQVRAVVEGLGEQAVAASAANDAAQRRSLLNQGANGFDFQAIAGTMMSQAGVNVPANREADVIHGVAVYVMREIAAQLEKIRPRKAEIGAVELKNPTQAQVGLTLAGLDRQLRADWQLSKGSNGWRVTDILVSGRSLVARLASKLPAHAGTIDQLNAFLRGDDSG